MNKPVTSTELKQLSEGTLSFHDAVRARQSCRAFLSKPVPEATIMQVLEDAQLAPSNCNTQPWNVHIVSGSKREALSRVLLEKEEAGEYTPDFTFSFDDYYGDYLARQKAQGKAYYQGPGIERDDAEGRRRVVNYNHTFFGAPHVALLFMPAFGDNVRVAGDIGMYGQTFLLSCAARGLGGVPQTLLGLFAGTIREFLDIPDEYKMLFGISFGFPDPNASANRIKMDRVPVTESVTFHS